MKCQVCSTQLEGDFALPPLLRLTPADLAFVTDFVKSSGSLKEIARLRGQSYPTVRNRLNDIITQLESATTSRRDKQHEILDAIAKGTMSVAEGAKRLQEVEA